MLCIPSRPFRLFIWVSGLSIITVCNMFAKESWDWVMFALIYLRFIGWIILHWISLRSSCNDLSQNSNIISTFYKSFFLYCITADINLVDLHWMQLSQHGHHATLPQSQSSWMPTTQHSLNSLSNKRQFKLFTHDRLKKTCLLPTWARILLW